MKYVAFGRIARMMAEMSVARALADERGKLLLFYHPEPDVVEVTQFLQTMTGAEKLTVLDGADETLLNLCLDFGTENVLITNGDAIPMSFQLQVGAPEFRWPKDWFVLASKDGGTLMMPRGPWAACFSANAVYRSKPWRNVGERSRREVMEMARQLFINSVTEGNIFSIAPNSFEPVETLIRARKIRSAGDILDLATAACIAARQEQRMTVTAADTVAAIAVKSHLGRRTPTATPDQVAATATAG